jgi:large conductance mechanosensitive channel
VIRFLGDSNGFDPVHLSQRGAGMKTFLNEFKEFALRGSVLDLAVAVVVGAAFTAIINSIVADLIMPLIGLILGGINFAGLSFTIGNATFTYGNLIQAIIVFLATALVLFLIIKAANFAMKKKEEAPAPPPVPTKEEELLTEIRDLLKQRSIS